MTDTRTFSEAVSPFAAEHALRLLTGQELRDAAGRELNEHAFAAEVARWRGRLAPLAEEIEAIAPPVSAWDRIERETRGRAPANDNDLQHRLRVWKSATGAMTALAACLAIVLVVRPVPAPVRVPNAPFEQARSAPMVAMLGDKGQVKVVASWDPTGRQLVLAVAGDMPADPAHAHELWVIPAGGKPRSLGTMDAGKQMHMELADALASLLEQGATIAISVEPAGGSPTGAPTGPVVASGPLSKA